LKDRLKPSSNGIFHNRDGDDLSCAAVHDDFWDNTISESFLKTLKAELVPRNGFATRSEARGIMVFEWSEMIYNLQRLHSTLGYLPPTLCASKTRAS
jgi:transposase InsO family protein